MRLTSKEVAEKFESDPDLIEVTKGVFVSSGEAVYIVDDQGEVISWNLDEWTDDPEIVTGCVVSCIVAAQKGASAVRKNIELSEQILKDMPQCEGYTGEAGIDGLIDQIIAPD